MTKKAIAHFAKIKYANWHVQNFQKKVAYFDNSKCVVALAGIN